jgi:hypothetical protein
VRLCTSGQTMSGIRCIQEVHSGTAEEIRATVGRHLATRGGAGPALRVMRTHRPVDGGGREGIRQGRDRGVGRGVKADHVGAPRRRQASGASSTPAQAMRGIGMSSWSVAPWTARSR